jgi:hypothetical protein
MRTNRFVLIGLVTAALSVAGTLAQQSAPDTAARPPQGDPQYKPKRINKAIELLESGESLWFTGATGDRDYEDGKKMALTYADYIDYPLEHEPFDMAKLRRFMQGLVDGGPARSGHRTPAVLVTLPVLGITEAQTRANDWMVNQVLAAGVHGIVFCRARDAGSVRAVLEAGRWPYHTLGVGPGKLGEGYRGAGSQGFAARIWGLSAHESPSVTTRPSGTDRPPTTVNVFPSASAWAPTARRFRASSANRSLSFTRSSPTSLKTVVPFARLASTESSGISSINPGISPAATSVEFKSAGRTIKSATGSPTTSRVCSTPTPPPIRARTRRNPVRVGLVPTPRIRSSPRSAKSAAPTRKAAEEASPGICCCTGSTRPVGASTIHSPSSSTR